MNEYTKKVEFLKGFIETHKMVRMAMDLTVTKLNFKSIFFGTKETLSMKIILTSVFTGT